MTYYPLDIIIPVWNSPVAVRAALASFATDSPMARLIMVNNGSERETESILHEFAEALDDRALLLSTGRNIGTVAALNLGLSRSTAQFVLISNPYVRLSPGWFEQVQTVLDQADAGAVRLRSNQGVNIEADFGSFAAMVLKRELLHKVTGFDEQMDNADWALRDFARRATAARFQTFSVGSGQLRLEQHQDLGSRARRELRERAARQLYVERWGEPAAYLFICGETLPCESSAIFRETLLAAARQGDRMTIMVAHKLGMVLAQEGFAALHENIAFLPMPRFFAGRALLKAVDRVVSKDAAVTMITADEASLSLPRISFADFSGRIIERNTIFYREVSHAGGN
jgi:glycosyltransferase involved in cell wall biosynthesis